MNATALPTTDYSDNPTGCCPRFHPEDWESKVFSLDPYKFIRATTRNVAHIPLNMGSVMKRTQQAIEDAGAQPKDRYFMLSRDLSPWQAEHFFLVERDVPGHDTVPIPGTYLARVFDGPFKDMPQWLNTLRGDLAASGRPMENVYAFYTTCPKCAKVYGHNPVVLLARVEDELPADS